MSMRSPPTPQRSREQVLQRMRRHRPFREMLSCHGVDLNGTWWRGSETMIFQALQRCAACPDTAACRRWCQQPHSINEYAGFCPNGAVIEACRMLDPHAAATARIPDTDEPSLSDLLGDEPVRLLMKADKIGTFIKS